MAGNRRIVAFFTFGWTLAAAGMAALALNASGDIPDLEDVQVGERGDQTRIALLCTSPCTLEKRGEFEFLLHGASAEMTLDLTERTKNVDTLTAVPSGDGSLLRVKAERPLDYANVKNCTVGGHAAACIDLFFTDVKTSSAVPADPTQNEKPVAAAPALREGASERLSRFAALAPPERLQPPSTAILAKVQPIEKSIEVRKPEMRAQEPSVENAQFDFAARIRIILGKDLASAYCNNAGATLEADPWALNAMVDVGLCAAVRGDVTEAEEILSRLLEYTPDNYEAYVGRALIAEAAGEKSVARRYFQDALNTLPPIEESNRIVEAMAQL